MIDRLGFHRADHGDVVDDTGCMWKEFAKLDSALSIPCKLERAAQNVAFLLVKMDFELAAGIGLPVVFLEGGLRVEKVHLTRSTVLE